MILRCAGNHGGSVAVPSSATCQPTAHTPLTTVSTASRADDNWLQPE
ncbi:MAG TPA: hypothetical protein VET27_05535 [Mycobacterium sp.]|nr:hypothetical protein [Mycobacterium sp.]